MVEAKNEKWHCGSGGTVDGQTEMITDDGQAGGVKKCVKSMRQTD